MTRKKPTISDVAKFADVSKAAVSMVLSGKGRISPWTTKRINEAIDQLGYVRNISAATLKSGKTGLLAVLIHGIARPFNLEILQGVNNRFDQEGKVAFILNYENREDIDSRVNIALNYNVDGFLILDHGANAEAAEQRLQQLNIPCVLLSSVSVPKNDNHFGIHAFDGAALATRHLNDQGHRHIAFIGGQSNAWDRIEKLAGYFSVLKKNNVEEEKSLIITSDHGQQSIEALTRALLTTHPWVTALLCNDAAATKSAIAGIASAGRTIGKDTYIRRDIALISLEKMDDAALFSPSITCVDYSVWQLGWNIAHLLSFQVDEREETAEVVAPTPQLLLRESA